MTEEQAEYRTNDQRPPTDDRREEDDQRPPTDDRREEDDQRPTTDDRREEEDGRPLRADDGGEEDELVRGTQEKFRNLREAAGYLKSQGWKVSQSTLYKHQGEGKVKAEPDGTYTLKNLMRYAKAYLTTVEGKRKQDDEELQRKKILAEIRRIDEQGKFAKIRRMFEEGKYILRDQFELELAARAAALEAALLFMVQSRVGNWIRIVSGDFHKTQDLIADVQEAVNDSLNEFASDKEFHVLFNMKDDGRPPTADGREEGD